MTLPFHHARRRFLATTVYLPALGLLSTAGLSGCGALASAARPLFWLLPDAAAVTVLLPSMLSVPPRPATVTAGSEHAALRAISRLLPALSALSLPHAARALALLAVAMDDAQRVCRATPPALGTAYAPAALAAAQAGIARRLALPTDDAAALSDAYQGLPAGAAADAGAVDQGWRVGQAAAALTVQWAAADGADTASWGAVRPLGGVLLPTATPAPNGATSAPLGGVPDGLFAATVQGVLDELEGDTDSAAVTTTLATVAVTLHACTIAAHQAGDASLVAAAWPHATAAVLAAARPERAAALRHGAGPDEHTGAALGLTIARAVLAVQPPTMPEVSS